MTKLKLNRETIGVLALASPVGSRGPKPITAVCHVPVQKPSFACQIRRP